MDIRSRCRRRQVVLRQTFNMMMVDNLNGIRRDWILSQHIHS